MVAIFDGGSAFAGKEDFCLVFGGGWLVPQGGAGLGKEARTQRQREARSQDLRGLGGLLFFLGVTRGLWRVLAEEAQV